MKRPGGIHPAGHFHVANSAWVEEISFARSGQLVMMVTTQYEALKRLTEVETGPGLMGWRGAPRPST